MTNNPHFEDRASSSRTKHEGESSFGLCDRLSRNRDNSQRQLPTDQDYAVSTREYQTDQSSLTASPTAAGSVLEKPQEQQRPNPRIAQVDRVTPYQANALIEWFSPHYVSASGRKTGFSDNWLSSYEEVVHSAKSHLGVVACLRSNKESTVFAKVLS